MNKAETEHVNKVLEYGCIACRTLGFYTPDCEVHHIGNGAMGKRASNYEVIPLCAMHHRLGGYGVAVHAGRKVWEDQFGTEQELLAAVMESI